MRGVVGNIVAFVRNSSYAVAAEAGCQHCALEEAGRHQLIEEDAAAEFVLAVAGKGAVGDA
jgi:hypothetical protein